MLAVFYLPNFRWKQKEIAKELTDWCYTDSEGKEQQITIPGKLYQDDNGNIEIYTTLPECFENEQTICFWTYYQSVEVYLEEKEIYQFDNSEADSFGSASTPTWNYIDISENSSGKQITIKMHTPYPDVNLRLEEVIYGNFIQLQRWMDIRYGLYKTVDSIFLWVGILFFIMAVIQKTDKRFKLYQLYSSMVLLLFSIYLRTGVKGMQVYWINHYFREFLCYFCLLSLSIPLTLYIRARVHRKPRMVTWCNVLFCLEVIIVSGIFILHALEIRDTHYSMKIGLLLLLAAMLTGVFCACYYYIKERDHISILTVCNSVIMLVVLLVEYLQFYQLNTLPFETGFMSRVGAILLIVFEATININYLGKNEKKQQLMEEENRNLQLHILTSQIRPHFILNTLGAIRSLIKRDPDQASELLYDFSKYIRKNMEQKDYTKLVPFLEELDYIETYLKLEKLRFGDRLQVEYDIRESEFMILPLTIQPFVENAVKHGLQGSKHGGTVNIYTKNMADGIHIEICDNGVGFDISNFQKNLEQGKSVGMRSAIIRLKEGMKAECIVDSSQVPGSSGTSIQIKIPKNGGMRYENNHRR